MTVASLSPSVVVSTGVLYSNLVPSGRSPTLPIESLAFGWSPGLTVWSLATGVFKSAWVGFATTVTLTDTSSLEPSGYVTTTVASFSPSVVVSTGVLYSNVVPLGRSETLPIEFLASGVSPTLTVWSLAVGVFLSASVRGSLTVTLTGTSSLDPSG